MHFLSSWFDWEWVFKILLVQKQFINLIKMQKQNLFIIEKLKNTESAQLDLSRFNVWLCVA